MRHWAFTLDAARSIVLAKAEQMDNDKLIGYLMLAVILITVAMGVADMFKPKEPKDAPITIDLAQLPKGSIIVLPAEK